MEYHGSSEQMPEDMITFEPPKTDQTAVDMTLSVTVDEDILKEQ